MLRLSGFELYSRCVTLYRWPRFPSAIQDVNKIKFEFCETDTNPRSSAYIRALVSLTQECLSIDVIALITQKLTITTHQHSHLRFSQMHGENASFFV